MEKAGPHYRAATEAPVLAQSAGKAGQTSGSCPHPGSPRWHQDRVPWRWALRVNGSGQAGEGERCSKHADVWTEAGSGTKKLQGEEKACTSGLKTRKENFPCAGQMEKPRFYFPRFSWTQRQATLLQGSSRNNHGGRAACHRGLGGRRLSSQTTCRPDGKAAAWPRKSVLRHKADQGAFQLEGVPENQKVVEHC